MLLAFHAGAQSVTELVVGGRQVAGLDQQTVPGVSYAPAEALAAAFGAELQVYWDTVSLQLGATELRLRLSSDTVRTDSPGSVALNGELTEGHAAVVVGDQVLLPVKTVSAAFGGFITVLSGNRDAVDVRLPRASLTALGRSTDGGRERLTMQLSAAVPFSSRFDAARNTLTITFQRTQPRQPEATLEGVLFEHVNLVTGEDLTEVRIRLAEGSRHVLERSANNGGWQLSVALDAGPMPGAASGRGSVRITHLPGQQTADLAQAIAGLLTAQDLEAVAVSGSSMSTGAGTDVQLLLLNGAQASVAYLADAGSDDALQRALALADGQADAIAGLRRDLLLGVYADLEVGASVAASLAQDLQLEQPPQGLPLLQLSQAAGNGAALWLSPQQLADPDLPARIAAALARTLESR